MDATPLSEEDLTDVYNWIDQLPLSRPKKNITRDFSDGGNNLIYHSFNYYRYFEIKNGFLIYESILKYIKIKILC